MTNRLVASFWWDSWKVGGVPRGKNSTGSLYYDGPVIYSYGSHFPIARYMLDTCGRVEYVLFTARGYSQTTACHKGLVRRAIDSGTPLIEVEDPTAEPSDEVLARLKKIKAYDFS